MAITPDHSSALAKIDAVILAGGLGTRLRTQLPDHQKVLADINGEPLLAKLISWLHHHGARRMVLALGYQSQQVTDFLSHPGLPQDCQFIASIEPEPRGTAGALRHALPHLTTDTVLVMNGDSFAPINLPALLSQHRIAQARITLGVCAQENSGRFGTVTVSDVGEVTAFIEKPIPPPHPPTPSPTRGEGEYGAAGYISAGIYLMERSVIAAIPPNHKVSLERDIFPQYVHRGLWALRQQVPFIDIGTPASYQQRHHFFASVHHEIIQP
ncbi:MAG: NTP transferase domain-containing protein [Magnetococcales bacterium]|nr:NTP transferase domain-containing protein [Magnetococcales bacterium]